MQTVEGILILCFVMGCISVIGGILIYFYLKIKGMLWDINYLRNRDNVIETRINNIWNSDRSLRQYVIEYIECSQKDTLEQVKGIIEKDRNETERIIIN